MSIGSDLMFLDTCVLQMFADSRDILRKRYSIRTGSIDSSLRKNRGALVAPMAAFGEVICKIRDKNGGRSVETLVELNRLLDRCIIVPFYIKNGYDTFGVAKKMTERNPDERDNISPMDAFIIASAITEPRCRTLLTSDSTLTFNPRLSEIANDYREQHGYDPFSIRNVDEILKK